VNVNRKLEEIENFKNDIKVYQTVVVNFALKYNTSDKFCYIRRYDFLFEWTPLLIIA